MFYKNSELHKFTILEQLEDQIPKKHNTKKYILQLVARYLNEGKKSIRKSYTVTNLILKSFTVVLTVKHFGIQQKSSLKSRRQNKLRKNRPDEKL